ncbi:putative Late nodulin [Medicago truncatula]|uniref:Putative Late nodulin n=1 Tax=Medicago truncatula TaxID=3880 RepID=A0A396JK56_MEDTR|nr:putative Late nodulin [Medicago truncatula]
MAEFLHMTYVMIIFIFLFLSLIDAEVHRCIEYTDCPEDMCHLPLVVVCHDHICKCLRLP